MNSAKFSRAFLATVCLVWLMACAHSDETISDERTQTVLVTDQIGFDFADGIKLPEDWTKEQKVFTLQNFKVGNGPNRILIVGVQFELQGSEAIVDEVSVAGVTFGGQALNLLPGSEIQFSWNHRGINITFEMFLYYLINPPSGSQDITVTYAGPVPSGNVGAISLYNVKQTAPLVLATNTEDNKKKAIIAKVTTKTDGAWIVDMVGCNHKSDLKPQVEGHILRFNAQEFSGGKSSLLGGTLPVPAAGEVTLHWAMKKWHNRLAHVAVEISPYQ